MNFDKQCSGCNQIKTLDHFYKDRRRKDGHRSLCIDCHKFKRDNLWRLNEKNKKLYMKDYNKKYFEKNKHTISEKRKTGFYKRWKPSEEQNKFYYFHRNPERTRNNRRRYYRKHFNNDLSFRILNCLRSRLYRAVKNKNSRKQANTLSLIGCSLSEFRKYIENLWRSGMSWDNFGEWQIDHIIPCDFLIFLG
jgi:hypothetical protein